MLDEREHELFARTIHVQMAASREIEPKSTTRAVKTFGITRTGTTSHHDGKALKMIFDALEKRRLKDWTRF